jgi:hypothetical protein
MSHNQQIVVLETNRLIRSPEEASAFEQALAELAQNPNPADLLQLHLVLDDGCQQPEVMFNLIHFLESFDLQEQLQAFIQVLPNLAKSAVEWIMILHTRIANDANAQNAFEEILRSMNNQKRDEIHRLLSLISGNKSSEQETKVA